VSFCILIITLIYEMTVALVIFQLTNSCMCKPPGPIYSFFSLSYRMVMRRSDNLSMSIVSYYLLVGVGMVRLTILTEPNRT